MRVVILYVGLFEAMVVDIAVNHGFWTRLTARAIVHAVQAAGIG